MQVLRIHLICLPRYSHPKYSVPLWAGARTATRESADQYPRLDDVGDAESDEARSESAEPVPGHQAAAAAQRGGPLPRDLGDGSHDQHQGRRGLRTAGWPHPCRAGRARVLGRARGAAGAVGLGRRARPQRRADARRPHRLAQAYPEPLALHLLQLSQAAAGDGRREPGSARARRGRGAHGAAGVARHGQVPCAQHLRGQEGGGPARTTEGHRIAPWRSADRP